MIDLPAGNITIEIRVFTVSGLHTDWVSPPLQVLPPSKDGVSEYAAMFFDYPTGPFFFQLSLGQKTGAFLSSVAVAADIAALALDGENVMELVDLAMDAMAKVEINDFDTVKGVSTTILLITAVPHHVSAQAQVHGASALKAAFKTTRRLSGNWQGNSSELSVDDVDNAVVLMFTGDVIKPNINRGIQDFVHVCSS
ncbi:uncharacterized protein LOC118416281 [Branchiostoma floridae]|uniref:Uncharacterized protein LOC118416281 n=1 Tax=Branchiostoma floridae TaxID=7739 RepID=A0A9J7L6X8_BRAFL|nr:uncharacterized protein LOC118416281 [Branchiostoma floridae]